MSFRQEISSVCKSETPQIDFEVFKKIDDFVVLVVVSAQFLRNFVINYNTINNKSTSHASILLKSTLQRFVSKTLQNDSKGVEKFQHIRFCATCELFENFWSQNADKSSTKIKLVIQ